MLMVSEEFPGEDRSFGGNHLYVDLVPKGCWFKNVRTNVSPSDWDSIRKTVYKRAGFACEICGAKGRLEAHERWSYDDETHVQKLVRLIALCPDCHMVTHFGLASLRGKEKEAVAHFKKVSGLSYSDIKAHVEDAFDQWKKRSRHSYRLDLSMIEKCGVGICQRQLS